MPLPARIGRYRPTGVLGQGAMGIVYRAFDPHMQRSVALKAIQPALLADAAARSTALARLRNEAWAAGRIGHPGVVTVFDWHEGGRHAADACIAMELVGGGSLSEVLAATPRLAAPRVLDLMEQLLAALEAVHRQGVWHRDVKPSNLLLTCEGALRLADFGVARIVVPGAIWPQTPVGTQGAMAPELRAGAPADHRADIFSCGVLLLRLAAGHPALAAIASRAMAPRPELRFADAGEMRRALAAAGSGARTIGPCPAPVPSGAAGASALPCDASTLPWPPLPAQGGADGFAG